mgnify:CR=1 FL=1
MVQLAALLLGFPAGYLIRNKHLALVAMGVLLTALLVVQTTAVRHADRTPAIHRAPHPLTYAVAAGLVVWGHHVSTNRRGATQQPVVTHR